MRTAVFFVALLLVVFPAQAQDNDFLAQVVAQSGYVRSAPTLDAEIVTSVFDGDTLLVVGRNLDGTWFLVRRPGRMNNLGWISYTLIDWPFRQERLPLADLTTGATGDTLLEADPGFAAYVIMYSTPMRSLPFTGEHSFFIEEGCQAWSAADCPA